MKTLIEKLNKIQTELKAPKGQTNAFGKYKYRSCEDIVEALKPLLRETGTTLVISDTMVLIGERYYCKATATLKYEDESLPVDGYARESESKKGMDASQITGATSSYARKYALNGLFCIDDTKDADTQDNTNQGKKEALKGVVQKADSLIPTIEEIALELFDKSISKFKSWLIDNEFPEDYSKSDAFMQAKILMKLKEQREVKGGK